MFDGFTIKVKNPDRLQLLKNKWLDFTRPVNEVTGELIDRDDNGSKTVPRQIAFYKGLRFTLYDSGSLYIRGSLHKYWNNGEHNHNDFSNNSLKKVLLNLQKKFNLKMKDCKLRKLEIGVNITPPIQTSLILTSCLLHKTAILFHTKGYKYSEHSHYKVKIYNKALFNRKKGYPIQKDILRIEISFNKMEKLNKVGIITLSDLLSVQVSILKTIVTTTWNNVLYYDSTINKINKNTPYFKNANYWLNLHKEKRNSFYKKKKLLQKLNDNYSENIHRAIKELISEKIDLLNRKSIQIDHIDNRSICTPTPISPFLHYSKAN